MQAISSALGSTSTAFPELTAKAFDRDMRSEEPLGDTKTHACGYYEIFYTAEQFRREVRKAEYPNFACGIAL